MYKVYSKLKVIVEGEFRDIVSSTNFVGGRASAPNKLRIFSIDNSFLDVWLSEEGETTPFTGNSGLRGA